MQNVERHRENNHYRYIRHAVIRKNLIAFCSEIGKSESKLVVLDAMQEFKIVFEVKG